MKVVSFHFQPAKPSIIVCFFGSAGVTKHSVFESEESQPSPQSQKLLPCSDDAVKADKTVLGIPDVIHEG